MQEDILAIVCGNIKIDLFIASSLLLVSKQFYELFIKDIAGYCYEEYDKLNIVYEFEHANPNQFINFYEVITNSDIKLKRLLKIIQDLQNSFIKWLEDSDEPLIFKSILRPLLTGELILKNDNQYTKTFLLKVYNNIANIYYVSINNKYHIHHWFSVFIIDYTKQNKNNLYIKKYFYKTYITLKFGKKDKYHLNRILLNNS
jgi:hypothetical protein